MLVKVGGHHHEAEFVLNTLMIVTLLLEGSHVEPNSSVL